MALLIDVRNAVVHYKMAWNEPKFVDVLRRRFIALSPPNTQLGWPVQIGTAQGIRWAHDTAARMILGIAQMIPDDSDANLGLTVEPLPTSYIDDWLRAAGKLRTGHG